MAEPMKVKIGPAPGDSGPPGNEGRSINWPEMLHAAP